MRNGAWGDHIVIVVLSNVLNVNITVVQAIYSLDVTPLLVPLTVVRQQTGLIHFVGLDKHVMAMSDSTVQSDSQIVNTDSQSGCDSPIDDATMEQGDEHTRQITDLFSLVEGVGLSQLCSIFDQLCYSFMLQF